MNEHSDIGRVLRHWFEDGPDAMPDRVVDTVAARVSVNRQRRVVHLVGRTAPMNRILTYVAAAAAVLIAAVAIWQFLPANTSNFGGQPTPTPTASPAPTDSVVDLPDGTLAAGQYRIRPLPDDPVLGNLTLVADLPADWQGHGSVPALTSPRADNDNGVLIGFMAPDTLFSDPCHWDLDGSGDRGQPGDIVIGPDRQSLVGALGANPAYTVIRTEPYNIDGFSAWGVELQLPGNDVLASCDIAPGSGGAVGDFLVFGGGFWAQGPDNLWQLNIIDVDGSLLIALVSYFDRTSAIQVAAGQAIVESFEITP